MFFPVPGLGYLLLHGALALSGVPVVHGGVQCTDPGALGGFVVETQTIELCPNNIKESNLSYRTVLRHEAIHVLHHNLGLQDGINGTILPPKTLHHLVRELMAPADIFSVINNYDYRVMNQEFEARLGQSLPTVWIAAAVAVSALTN